MKKEVTLCDGCGKIISSVSDNYHITKVLLETDSYVDASGDTDYNYIKLEFCGRCARHRLLPALEKIAGGVCDEQK